VCFGLYNKLVFEFNFGTNNGIKYFDNKAAIFDANINCGISCSCISCSINGLFVERKNKKSGRFSV
jgi:hypothetical protein